MERHSQVQSRERVSKYNDLVNKHMKIEKELITFKKKVFKGKSSADKKIIASLKKKRDNSRKWLEAEKEKKRLVNLSIE